MGTSCHSLLGPYVEPRMKLSGFFFRTQSWKVSHSLANQCKNSAKGFQPLSHSRWWRCSTFDYLFCHSWVLYSPALSITQVDSDSPRSPVGWWRGYFEVDMAGVIHSITIRHMILIACGQDPSSLAEVPFLVGWYPCSSCYWMLNILTNHLHSQYECTAY